jgi:hypothetical protein
MFSLLEKSESNFLEKYRRRPDAARRGCGIAVRSAPASNRRGRERTSGCVVDEQATERAPVIAITW